MFSPCSLWGLGCVRLSQHRLRSGSGRGALRAFQARRYGSGGGERRPGPELRVSAPGPARRTVKEWTLQVSPFGRLRARLPCHVAVSPLDPLSYPDGDRVLVAVCSVEGALLGLGDLQVRYDEALQEIIIASDNLDAQTSVEVSAPLKFDLNIKSLGSGCVKVQNIECDDCKIELEQGTSILQSVKSQKLHIQTKGGKVICLGTVYGNIDIRAADKSTVTVDKLQGSSVNISTEDGLLRAKYLYTESSCLSSATGDISLGSVHGNMILQSESGNITVESSSGCLKATTHQGAIDVYVSQLERVELESHKGSVIVKVPSSLQAYLQLSGREVDVSPEVHVEDMTKAHKGDSVTVTGFMNQTRNQENCIHAAAPTGTEHVMKPPVDAGATNRTALHVEHAFSYKYKHKFNTVSILHQHMYAVAELEQSDLQRQNQ
ncbi:protein FAM185A [Ctenodactylus gundi]